MEVEIKEKSKGFWGRVFRAFVLLWAVFTLVIYTSMCTSTTGGGEEAPPAVSEAPE